MRPARKRFLLVVPCLLMCAVLNSWGRTGGNETPKSIFAYAYEAYLYQSADNGWPVFNETLTQQGYVVTRYKDETFDDDPESATLTNFVNMGHSGVLGSLYNHGCTSDIAVEVYQTGAARDAAYNAYVAAGWNGGVEINYSDWWSEDSVYHFYSIDLKDTGFATRIKPQTDAWQTIVYLGGSCHSQGLFNDVGGRVRFGCSACPKKWDDNLEELLHRMSGIKGQYRGMGNHRSAGEAYSKGSYESVFKIDGYGQTTLCPVVLSYSPRKKCRSTSTRGYVQFDSKMETDIPPSWVLAAEGCGVQLDVEDNWSGDDKIEFDITCPSRGAVILTVDNFWAVSNNNGGQLDGNQNSPGTDGVRPNEDDFKIVLACGCGNYYTMFQNDVWGSRKYCTIRERKVVVQRVFGKVYADAGEGWFPVKVGDVFEFGTLVLLEPTERSLVRMVPDCAEKHRGRYGAVFYLNIDHGTVDLTEEGVCEPGEHCGISTPFAEAWILQCSDTTEITSLVAAHDSVDALTYFGNLKDSYYDIGTRALVGPDTITVCYVSPGYMIEYDASGVDTMYEYLAVELSNLAAAGHDGYSEIEWTTASEIDNAGFNLHRSLSKEGPYSQINDQLIPALGSAIEGASYSFEDYDVTDGVTYYYWLEDVDLHGIGTMHGPVSATPGQSLVEGEAQTPLLTSFSLAQNFPNPFNPMTEIKYALPKESYVKLTIYNLLGQRVTRLVDERQKAGFKTVKWDGSSFPSGIYLYRLQAGYFIQTRKMILLK